MTHLQPSLVREAHSKIRSAPFVVGGIALAASSLVALGVLFGPSAVQHRHNVVVYHAEPPTPATASPEVIDKEAPRPVTNTSIALADLSRTWIGVSASPTRKTLALWTASEVFVSYDGGERVEPIGIEGNIHAAASDELGKVWVLHEDAKGTRLTTIESGTTTQNQAVPIAKIGTIEHFAASASLVAVLAHTGSNADKEAYDDSPDMQILNTKTGEWKAWDFPQWGNAGNRVAISTEGVIDLMGGSEASCGGGYQYHYRSALASQDWREIDWPMDTPFGFVIGAEGWSYAFDSGCVESESEKTLYTICATDPVGKLKRVHGAPLSEEYGDAFLTASNGKVHYAAIAKTLVSLHGDGLETLATLPSPALSLQVDERGRALMMSEEKLWSWSPQSGWKALGPRLPQQ